MQIHFRASHAYVGCGVRVQALADAGQSCSTTVTFDDQSEASARVKVNDSHTAQVWVEGYTTVAGNVVKARAWRIERSEGGKVWKVVDRVGASSD